MISAASERRQVNRTAIQSLSGAKPLKQGKNKQEQKKKVKMNIIRYAKPGDNYISKLGHRGILLILLFFVGTNLKHPFMMKHLNFLPVMFK